MLPTIREIDSALEPSADITKLHVHGRIPSTPLKPFLIWPGGKRWLVLQSEFLPKQIKGRYFEPFLGGGALFFHLRPSAAVLGDRIPELICTYQAIRDTLSDLKRRLVDMHHQHCEAHYYVIRASRPRTSLANAARFLYLNRTCFNGIYRVNKQGEFNVPIGTKHVLRAEDTWIEWSQALQGADIRLSDFEPLVDEAQLDDFVFADPPYTVAHSAAGFRKYNEVLFSFQDQERLAQALDRARQRGVRILATNTADPSVMRLYGRGFKKAVVERFSRVAGGVKGRRMFPELIIQAG